MKSKKMGQKEDRSVFGNSGSTGGEAKQARLVVGFGGIGDIDGEVKGMVLVMGSGNVISWWSEMLCSRELRSGR